MILTGDKPKIMELINSLHRATKSLISACLEISYYSRGAYTYDKVLKMSAIEREMAAEFLSERNKALAKNPFAQI